MPEPQRVIAYHHDGEPSRIRVDEATWITVPSVEPEPTVEDFRDRRRLPPPEVIAGRRADLEEIMASEAMGPERRASLRDEFTRLARLERWNALKEEKATICPDCYGFGGWGQRVYVEHDQHDRILGVDPQQRILARHYCACVLGAERRAAEVLIEDDAQRAIDEHRLERLWGGTGIPDSYRAYTLETWLEAVRRQSSEGRVVRASQAVVEYLRTWQTGTRWLYIHGPWGTGKTGVLVGLLERFLRQGTPTLFRVSPDLLEELRQEIRRQESPAETTESLVDSLATIPILAIDDLDKARPTGWVRERLYMVLNRRYLHDRRTLFTSNVALSDPLMEELLGEAIIQRIEERCSTSGIVRFAGPNLRQPVTRDAS